MKDYPAGKTIYNNAPFFEVNIRLGTYTDILEDYLRIQQGSA